MESYQRKKLVAFFCFKNRDLLKSYCNKRIRKVIINDNGHDYINFDKNEFNVQVIIEELNKLL